MPQFPEISLYLSALERRIPGRKLERYDVPQNLWKYWAPALNADALV